jgi:hypothetical protein
MTKTIAAAMIVALGLAWQGNALAQGLNNQDRTAEAVINYEQVKTGGRQIHDLTPQQLADVIEIDRRIREKKPDNRTPSQRCVDAEIKGEGGSVSELQRRAIDMKCREAGD